MRMFARHEQSRARRWPLLVFLVFAPLAPAHAMPRHVEVVLQPGGVHTDCFMVRSGQQVTYNFKLDRPGRFNLHYRRGKDVVHPIRSESVSEQKGDYRADVAREYCLMWTVGMGGATTLGYEFIVVEPGLTKP